MTGPIQFSRLVGSPTAMFAARSASRSTNSAATLRSTYTRELALHFWPSNPNEERATPSAASSMSALAMTMAGFLPPISVMIGRG